jgi:hypothetical protein
MFGDGVLPLVRVFQIAIGTTVPTAPRNLRIVP